MRKTLARLLATLLLAGSALAGATALAPAASAHNWTYPPCPRSPYTEGRTYHALSTYKVNRNTGSMQPWVTMYWRITQYNLAGQGTTHTHVVERRCDI